MTAGRYDILCVADEDLEVEWTVYNPDGELANLNLWQSRMQVRETVAAETVTLDCSTTNGRIVHSVADGTITLSLSSSTIAEISSGDYVYDLELYTTTGADRVLRLVEGFFKVS